MNQFALLRILFASFLLYVAWAYIPLMYTVTEKVFWGVWLFMFVLIVGGNGISLLQMKTTTGMLKEEQSKERSRDH